MRIRRVSVWKHEHFTIIPRKRCFDYMILRENNHTIQRMLHYSKKYFR